MCALVEHLADLIALVQLYAVIEHTSDLTVMTERARARVYSARIR